MNQIPIKLRKKALFRISGKNRKFTLLEFKVRAGISLQLIQEDSNFQRLVEETANRKVNVTFLEQDDGGWHFTLQFLSGSYKAPEIRRLASSLKLEITGPSNFLRNLGKQPWLMATKDPNEDLAKRLQEENTVASIITPTNLNKKRKDFGQQEELEMGPSKKLKAIDEKLSILIADVACLKENFQKKELGKKEKNSLKLVTYEQFTKLFAKISEAKEAQQSLFHQNEQTKIFFEAKEKFLLEKEIEINQLKLNDSLLEEKKRELNERERTLGKREEIVHTDKLALDTKIKEFLEAARKAAMTEESSKKEIQRLETESKKELRRLEYDMRDRLKKAEQEHLSKLNEAQAKFLNFFSSITDSVASRIDQQKTLSTLTKNKDNKENEENHETFFSLTSYVR